ncbi:unnamed protein product [Nezara viridula]|uniref:SH2 domain-containing protein n=1 Tax=Nezara viridula TaxID=85310 RepID=A0A9P0MWA4_NEZVI|nr:unnamed protein product [Nezara viridula]
MHTWDRLMVLRSAAASGIALMIDFIIAAIVRFKPTGQPGVPERAWPRRGGGLPDRAQQLPPPSGQAPPREEAGHGHHPHRGGAPVLPAHHLLQGCGHGQQQVSVSCRISCIYRVHRRVSDGSDSKVVGPPAPPERTDSLNNRPEDGELKTAPWFQAGIPREITLEVLGQEPVGSFMVRESTSKPGCFALSLRVPHEFQPLGIAHYLILRTNKGYKIKGFTKEFRTLTALITHHSVMPELLPCPLSLSRYNPTYSQQDTRRDFADIDSDPDYNTLADFRRMMADLNV